MKSILFITLYALCINSLSAFATEKKSPNIILILSDDMGYSDLGCYGGDIHTPNLDALAAKGLRFSQFYNQARCCPTRASLMTGLYPHQTGIGHMTNPPLKSVHNYDIPEYQGDLNDECVTIAEVLKSTGYTTLMTGKWHLGWDDKADWPLQRGFDKFYGCTAGATNYFKPVYPRGMMLMNDTINETAEDYYSTDAFTEYAISFIKEAKHKDAEQPFFLYLAYTAPHWPLHAPAEDVEKYIGKYQGGWSKMRKERYKRMMELGLIDANWKLSNDAGISWESLSDEKKNEMDLRRAIYSAQVDRMDQNIGHLINYLEENNSLDNTLIIFLNDNGACAEGGDLGTGPQKHLLSQNGFFLSYGKAWANASNTPYREYKHWVHEGGISSPCIVHWPDGIKPKLKGNIINNHCFLQDIMATCIDISGAKYPLQRQSVAIHPLVGKSMNPFFNGKTKDIHQEPIFWEHEGNKAVRLGNYKLVSKWNKQAESSWELYNIKKDRTETNDLAQKMPQKVRQMKAMYDKWSEATKVLPWNEILPLWEKNKKAMRHQ